MGSSGQGAVYWEMEIYIYIYKYKYSGSLTTNYIVPEHPGPASDRVQDLYQALPHKIYLNVA